MKLLSLNTVALALLVIGVTGLMIPTAAAPGSDQDRVWDDPAITLAPTSGPNGQYARIDSAGNLTVDISGVNAEAMTVIEDVFTVTNDEDTAYRVWVSHGAGESVRFYVGDNRTLQEPDDPVVLDPDETRAVSLAVDGTGATAGETLMTSLTVHAEQVSTGTPTATASPAPAGPGAGPGPPTPSITPTPEPAVEEQVEVEFVVRAADGEAMEPPPDGAVTVRPMAISELDTEDPLVGPRAVINHSRRGPVVVGAECPCPGEPDLRARGANALTAVGEPINLSGTRSLVGQASGVDRQRRIILLVDITVPPERRNQPGVVRLTIDRRKFGDTDPKQATIARKSRGGWQLLETRVARSTPRNVTLEARTPGFSPFAVFVDNEVRYQWTLPDGTAVFGKQIQSRFDEPGIYNVTLTVTDAFGRSNTAVYRIIVNDQPTVGIEGLGNVTPGEPVTLRANVTDEVGDVTVTWTFADGTTAVGPTVTRPLEAGQPVRVTAVDEFGARGNATGVVGRAGAGGRGPAVRLASFGRAFASQLALLGAALIFLYVGLRRLIARREQLGD